MSIGPTIGIRHRHQYVVDVVAPTISRRFVVRGGDKTQGPGAAVDGELGGICAAADGIGEGRANIGIGCCHRGHGSRILRHADCRREPPSVARNGGRRIPTSCIVALHEDARAVPCAVARPGDDDLPILIGDT